MFLKIKLLKCKLVAGCSFPITVLGFLSRRKVEFKFPKETRKFYLPYFHSSRYPLHVYFGKCTANIRLETHLDAVAPQTARIAGESQPRG